MLWPAVSPILIRSVEPKMTAGCCSNAAVWVFSARGAVVVENMRGRIGADVAGYPM